VRRGAGYGVQAVIVRQGVPIAGDVGACVGNWASRFTEN
jgi:hypothetical protein